MRRTNAARIEEAIARLAVRQHGVVTRRQLLAAGLTRHMVDGRVSAKRLRWLHRGVYLVGPLAPARAREMAAALACGDGAVVSHGSAATLWVILPALPHGPVHVTIPGSDRGRRNGIRPHRVAGFEPEDVGVVDGIPVTSPARTLMDLAGQVRSRKLEQAIARAEERNLVRLPDLRGFIERHPGRPGARALRTLLDLNASPALTRSEAEDAALSLIRRGGLPAPRTNVVVGGFELDFYWPDHGVAVEVDGFAYHASRRAFEGDRARDAHLARLGIHVIRVTWRRIVAAPEEVLVTIAQTLARAEARPGVATRSARGAPNAGCQILAERGPP